MYTCTGYQLNRYIALRIKLHIRVCHGQEWCKGSVNRGWYLSKHDQIFARGIKRSLMTNFYAYAPKFAYIYVKNKKLVKIFQISKNFSYFEYSFFKF